MGYNSTMEQCEFISAFTLDQIKKKFDEFKHKTNSNYLDYSFEYNGDGWYEVVPEYSAYKKHYADKWLAIFISSIIKPGTSTELTFIGEDGEHWGWYIEHLKLKRMYIDWKYAEKYEDIEKDLKLLK